MPPKPHLFLTDRGSSEAVLLVTGWTISSAVFDPVGDLYLPHVRVIAYDHRRTGRSAVWPAPVSPALLAADAARQQLTCARALLAEPLPTIEIARRLTLSTFWV